ncbi:MAG: AMP-binding protein [Crocinitomicaceae bacterium]|nr:AMP-binding protein [Crocinitomicaceae bacterium]
MSFLENIEFVDESRRTEIEVFLEEWNSTDAIVKVNSSGSTGTPKTIAIEKKFMLQSAKKTLEFLHLKKGDTAYLCLSTETIAGKMMVIRCILGELKLVVGPISTSSLSSYHSKIDFTAIVPLQLEHVLTNHPTRLQSIHSVIVGGAPVSDRLINELKEKQLTVFQTYGMTETISHVAMRKIGFQSEEFYTALPRTSFSLGKQDNLIIHSPDIGIENLETTDAVELLSPTQFSWKGRTDFIINSGGKKIVPEEVEKVISTLIDCPFFVSAVEDQSLGQKVILVIEGIESIRMNKIILAELLPKFQVPKEVVYFNEFVRTASGKINRIESMKLYPDAFKEIL